jgi:predicted alpha/beta superfamily hydrolase
MGEWKADEIAERLIKTGRIEPLIIVAIANTPARIEEYTLTRDAQRNQGGNGEAYMRFMVEELKPFIDTTYRTKSDRANTGVAGSSLGATISLELCRAHPDVFGKCAAISPSLWWGNGDLPRRLQVDNAWIKNCRIWMDIGAAEASPKDSEMLVAGVKLMAGMFQEAGAVEGKDFKVEIVRGAHHEESAWAARFDRVLMFLFPRSI